MIFWILLGLTLLITIGNTIDADYYDRFLALFGSLVICLGVSGVILLLCGTLIPWNNDVVKDDTYRLRTLGTANGIEGHSYFLGGGYINSERVLNYITQRDGGAIQVQTADADVSVVFEDAPAGTGTVQKLHVDHINGWVTPWPLGSHDQYVFHIPAGTVADSYSLTDK